MPLDPHRLLVLRAVHRAGGVVPASRALFLTPSAVSQHLSRLEEETGLALVDRTRRGGGRALELTPAGRTLAEHGDRLSELLADVDNEVAQLRGHRTGPVRIGGFSTVLRRLVAPAVVDLAIAEPGIVPTVLEVDAEDEGLALVRGGELDLVVLERLPDARPPRGVEITDLMRDAYRVVVPAIWEDDGAETLLRGRWIGGRAGTPALKVLHALGDAAGVRLDVRHTCDEFTSMLALVGAGLGAAIVTDLVLDFLPVSGVRTSSSLDPGARVLYAAHRRGRAEPGPAASAALEAMRAQARL